MTDLLEFNYNEPDTFEYILYNKMKEYGLSHVEIMARIQEMNENPDPVISEATKRLEKLNHEIVRNNKKQS